MTSCSKSSSDSGETGATPDKDPTVTEKPTEWTLVDEQKYPPIETPNGKMYKIQDAPPSAGPEYDALASAAAKASDAGDHKTALENAEAALAIDPERMAPRSVAASACCKLGKTEEAIAHIGRLKGFWIDVAIDQCIEDGVTFPEGSVKRFETPGQ